MLGKTAGGLFWMFRFLERSENTARLIDAGFRIALTRPNSASNEWASVIETAGVRDAFLHKYDEFDETNVIDFLLRDADNSSSVLASITAARTNARLVRTALTREVWEATNECWMALEKSLKPDVLKSQLPELLRSIRQQNAQVRGALHGTMLRNDVYDFARLGTFIERVDNTARILDVKYYVLLPSAIQIGSAYDNVQWETILRSVSAQSAYRHLNGANFNAKDIAKFVILDQRLPRSLTYCYRQVKENIDYLEEEYGQRHQCSDMADELCEELREKGIDEIIEQGLHEFLNALLERNNTLAVQIQRDYRFNE
jgi:uncharacterized alpha-E superfamily protein